MSLSFSPRVRRSLRWVFAALTAAGIVLHFVAVYDLLVLFAARVHWDPSLPESLGAVLWRHARVLTDNSPFFLLGSVSQLLSGGAPLLWLRREWQNFSGLFVNRECLALIYVYAPRLLLIPWLIVLVHEVTKRRATPSDRQTGDTSS